MRLCGDESPGEKRVVALVLDTKDYSGRKALTKTKGKNDRSILLSPKPEM
jgi:hypothetical protein